MDQNNIYLSRGNNKNNKYFKKYKIIKIIKIWIILMIAITIIYLICWYCAYEIVPVAYYSKDRQFFLRNNTMALPPPLINFMDPPSVLDNKYNVGTCVSI